jgi:hypothetical protein
MKKCPFKPLSKNRNGISKEKESRDEKESHDAERVQTRPSV